MWLRRYPLQVGLLVGVAVSGDVRAGDDGRVLLVGALLRLALLELPAPLQPVGRRRENRKTGRFDSLKREIEEFNEILSALLS